MSIKEVIQKFNPLQKFDPGPREDILTVLIMVLLAAASFGLGRLSLTSERKVPVTLERASQSASVFIGADTNSDTLVPKAPAGGLLVASKNGSKYYFPWCGTALRILEKNRIWFASKEEAEKSGYSPAANCKGLAPSAER